MISLEVKLPDTPGSLIELIKPISNNGGNIYGIMHHHDRKNNNMIPVSITFELSKEMLDIGLKKINKELKEKGIQIDKTTVGETSRHLTVILTGHVFDTDITDTIKQLASKEIKVTEVQAKLGDLSDESNVKFKLDFPEDMTEGKIIDELMKICKEKNLFLLRN